MQQLSGSSGLGGITTPAILRLRFSISERRSKGEVRREEKRIEGSDTGDAEVPRNGCGVRGAAETLEEIGSGGEAAEGLRRRRE